MLQITCIRYSQKYMLDMGGLAFAEFVYKLKTTEDSKKRRISCSGIVVNALATLQLFKYCSSVDRAHWD